VASTLGLRPRPGPRRVPQPARSPGPQAPFLQYRPRTAPGRRRASLQTAPRRPPRRSEPPWPHAARARAADDRAQRRRHLGWPMGGPVAGPALGRARRLHDGLEVGNVVEPPLAGRRWKARHVRARSRPGPGATSARGARRSLVRIMTTRVPSVTFGTRRSSRPARSGPPTISPPDETCPVRPRQT
jgi:hypothetical protein